MTPPPPPSPLPPPKPLPPPFHPPTDPGDTLGIFSRARRLTGPERTLYLDGACAGNAELRSEIESLLDASERTSPLLDRAALGLRDGLADLHGRLAADGALADRPRADPAPDWASGSAAPERVGDYRIIRVIGEGGMGVVYEAEQDQPRRRVALKVLRPGSASRAAARRFRHEAQILGQFRHPGIARIYEAGAAGPDAGPAWAGRPYFVMEFVDGLSLVAYADARGLSTRERLALFVKVCEAVQHAHQRGVIHRDLKPANILVEDTAAGPQPRVLDFGVARLLEEGAGATMLTDAGQLVGTLAYMSPEQVGDRPDDLDTRSDVYALGVVLYELLSGRSPLDLRRLSLPEAARAVREDEPPRLGTLDPALRGEVETIVAKALEKDRDRRYPSAAELAADMGRHLADEPIIAQPATTMYHLRKFARRNRRLVAAAGAVAAALVLGIFGTSLGLVRERAARADAELARAGEAAQRGAAERSAARAGAINTFILKRMLRAADPVHDGKDVKVSEVLAAAAGGAGDAFRGQPEVEGSVRRMIGQTFTGLGMIDAAGAQHERALTLLEAGGDDAETARARAGLAWVRARQDRLDEAQALFRAAIPGLEAALGPDDGETLAAVSGLGESLQKDGRHDEAQAILRDAARRARDAHADDDTLLTGILSSLGASLNEQHRFEEAEAVYREMLAEARRTGPERPATLAALSSLANTLVNRARTAEAEPLLREAVALAERILPEDNYERGTAELSLGICLARLGRADEAEPALRHGAAAVRASVGDGAYLTETALTRLSDFLYIRGKAEEAEAVNRELLAIRRRKVPPNDPTLLGPLRTLSHSLQQRGELAQAEAVLREILDISRAVYAEADNHRSWPLIELGMCVAAQGCFRDAEPVLLEGWTALAVSDAPPARRLAALEALTNFYGGWGRLNVPANRVFLRIASPGSAGGS